MDSPRGPTPASEDTMFSGIGGQCRGWGTSTWGVAVLMLSRAPSPGQRRSRRVLLPTCPRPSVCGRGCRGAERPRSKPRLPRAVFNPMKWGRGPSRCLTDGDILPRAEVSGFRLWGEGAGGDMKSGGTLRGLCQRAGLLLLSLLGHTQSCLPRSQNLTLEIHSFGSGLSCCRLSKGCGAGAPREGAGTGGKWHVEGQDGASAGSGRLPG